MDYHGVQLGRNWQPFYQGPGFIIRRAFLLAVASVLAVGFMILASLVYLGAADLSLWKIAALWALGLWVIPLAGASLFLGWLLCWREASPSGLIVCGVSTGMLLLLSLLYCQGFQLLGWFLEYLFAFPAAVALVPFVACDLVLACTRKFCSSMTEWQWLESRVRTVHRNINRMADERLRRSRVR